MGLGEDIERAMRDASRKGLLQAAMMLAEQAKRNVPVGDPDVDPDPNVSLRDSIHVEPTQDGFRVVADAPYAAKQEFDMSLRHPRGGQARYMGRAVALVMPRAASIVASYVKGETASGVKSRNWRT